MTNQNPTATIDVSFLSYISRRKALTESHMEGGVPDYAYGADYAMRQKINAIPGAKAFFKALTNQYVPKARQEYLRNGLKVGATQFSDVYDQVVECARILGIGIPTTIIINDPTINAFTIATDDEEPLIVIQSGLLERMTPGELKAVIGHECGHIHNNHGIYDIAIQLILNSLSINIPIVGQIISLASIPLTTALRAWDRAAEVTSDRAGIICSDDPKDAIMVDAKLAYGAAFSREDVNIDAIIKQYDTFRENPGRFTELFATHPASVRRILAGQEFLSSAVFYSWRPELKKPGVRVLNKQELDVRCDKFISITKSEKRM